MLLAALAQAPKAALVWRPTALALAARGSAQTVTKDAAASRQIFSGMMERDGFL